MSYRGRIELNKEYSKYWLIRLFSEEGEHLIKHELIGNYVDDVEVGVIEGKGFLFTLKRNGKAPNYLYLVYKRTFVEKGWVTNITRYDTFAEILEEVRYRVSKMQWIDKEDLYIDSIAKAEHEGNLEEIEDNLTENSLTGSKINSFMLIHGKDNLRENTLLIKDLLEMLTDKVWRIQFKEEEQEADLASLNGEIVKVKFKDNEIIIKDNLEDVYTG